MSASEPLLTLPDLLRARVRQHGARPFLIFEKQPDSALPGTSENRFSQRFSYKEFDQLVDQACEYMAGLGIQTGDVYNLHLPNCVAFMALWFAGMKLGAVMMPTNVLSSESELHYLLSHSKSRVSFTTANYQHRLAPLVAQLEQLETMVICDPYASEPGPGSFENALYGLVPRPPKHRAQASDLASIMYTSGTTSRPKGVMVTQQNYVKAGVTVAQTLGLTAADRHYTVLPLFHGNAQYYSTMSALVAGASVVLMDRFSASQYFDRCIHHRCTVASLFAAPIRMILAQPENIADRDNHLRAVLYAQNITEQQENEWNRRFGAPLSQLWGMTETMGPPLMNSVGSGQRNRTVGRAVGGYEVKIVDPHGNEVPDNTEGEIIVKGLPGVTIMQGYYANDKATKATIRDGWLFTGDNAFRDDDGFFTFVDRLKDMIKRSGENVSAGEVESVLMRHPAVFEAAVIGLPDRVRDEKIVAVVVLVETKEVAPQTLIDYCAAHLASFRVPEQIVFKSQLPKTSVGKIQKHVLKQSLINPDDPINQSP